MSKLEYSWFWFAQGIDHHGSMNCNAKIVNRFLDAQAYSSFGFFAQLDQFIDFTVSKQVYPVPLDPGDSTALDLRVVNRKSAEDVVAGVRVRQWHGALGTAVCLMLSWDCAEMVKQKLWPAACRMIEGLLDNCIVYLARLIGVAAVMKLLYRCFAPWVAVCLICRKPTLLLGRLLVALPDVGSVPGAIVVRWGCPGLAMRDFTLRPPTPRSSRANNRVSRMPLICPLGVQGAQPRIVPWSELACRLHFLQVAAAAALGYPSPVATT
ncbi:hypothetical protein CRG98_034596 [Punica granatum]|uniref:Uncharacterized protein n=1 Tax=Punica granatum TaxID=22663 RepID=A0A2I0ILZ2_PUNGR|nr:hypothetical protein CRG98_034596 [Punica granatum]